MHNPIKVPGPDISYPGVLSYIYIDGSKVLSAHPLFALKSETDDWWACTPDHKDAILVGYKLKHSDHELYQCIDPTELKKIGLELDPRLNNQPIDFIND